MTDLLGAWERGELPLRDALGVPDEARSALHALAARCQALGDRARAVALYSGLAALDPADEVAAAALSAMALDDGSPDLALFWAERTLPHARTAALEARRVAARRALALRG